MPRKRIPRDLTKAPQLRDRLSLSEALLWGLLKGSPNGVHFRSQHPIGDYVLDFYCAKAKVAFEIDGIVHDIGDQPEHDARRDAWQVCSRGHRCAASLAHALPPASPSRHRRSSASRDRWVPDFETC
ncbi:endonuclease domain-containing protein, partial [Novosphingobium sp.]|uniref:endonuclease domain-containing protein n=1 Tax=Novosphingobium sp. TaxID=1874826 RepID=UPI00386211A5